METEHLKVYSRQISLGTFIVSTALFMLFLWMQNPAQILLLGATYLCFAIAVNSILLLYAILALIRHPPERQDIAVRMLLQLSNIPIAVLYFLTIMNFKINPLLSNL